MTLRSLERVALAGLLAALALLATDGVLHQWTRLLWFLARARRAHHPSPLVGMLVALFRARPMLAAGLLLLCGALLLALATTVVRFARLLSEREG